METQTLGIGHFIGQADGVAKFLLLVLMVMQPAAFVDGLYTITLAALMVAAMLHHARVQQDRATQEAALRHAVDPSWRGVTPWVALIAADGSVSFGGGTPTRDRLDAWSKGAGAR